jgi:hypothetical protein
MLTPESFIMPLPGSEIIDIAGDKSKSISSVLLSKAKEMIQNIYLGFVESSPNIGLPLNPMALFTKKEIESIENPKKRIFYSYFCGDEPDIDIDFDTPANDFEDCILSIYIYKKGVDKNVKKIIATNPCFKIFTIPQVFDAIYRPHREMLEIIDIKFEDASAYCKLKNGEEFQYDCVDLLENLHHSPHLRVVTAYISENIEFFVE